MLDHSAYYMCNNQDIAIEDRYLGCGVQQTMMSLRIASNKINVRVKKRLGNRSSVG